jgi:hypothetical protein
MARGHSTTPRRSACSYRQLFKTLGLGPHSNGQDLDKVVGSLREPRVPYGSFVTFAEIVLEHEQAETKWDMSHSATCEP